MADQLTDAHYEWAGRFCNVPGLAASPASAVASTSGAATSGAAAPSAPPQINTAGMAFVQAKRLRELDQVVQRELPSLIDRAVATASDMDAFAATAKVDLDKPKDALAALHKGGPKVPDQDKINLQNALNEVNAHGDELKHAFIDFKNVCWEYLQVLADREAQPATGTAEKLNYDAERDGLEHLHDGAIQGLKFVLEAGSSPASAVLEILGTDILKDATKGGNVDELLEALTDSVNGLQSKTDSMIERLKKSDREKEKRLLATARQLGNLIAGEQRHYVDAFAEFDKCAKQVMDRMAAARAGKTAGQNPDLNRIQNVFQRITDANEAYQLVDDRVSGTVLSIDLKYWASVLVPLGTLVQDLGDSGQPGEVAGSITVYQQGGHQTAFYLPEGGLRNPLGTLSAAVQKTQQFEALDGERIRRLCDNWRSALANSF